VSSAGPAYEHRTVPNGCVEIAYALGSGVVRVEGPRQRPAVERHAPGKTLVGVRVRPGVASALLGAPALELLDVQVELDQLWGKSGAVLGERLDEAASTEAAARLLEHELVTRAAFAPKGDPLLTEAITRLQPWRAASVKTVTSELFISARQLRRRFVVALGCSPKQLQRILRFQGFLALCDAHTAGLLPLAQLARIAGYADQAHLTRECHQLSGITPRALLEELRHRCKPSHNHSASYSEMRRALLRTDAP
jgi:AraC-like DNA-binding protein